MRVYCSIAAPASATASAGLLVGIDGVAVLANTTTSCSASNGAANGFGAGVTMNVTSWSR